MVNEPRVDGHKGSTSSSMTVDGDFASLLNDASGKHIHDFHHLLKRCGSHVLPILVLEPDIPTKKNLWVVAETNHRINTIPAIWMLSL